MKTVSKVSDLKGYETLTSLEKKYFNVMFSKSGTLYIKGRAGEGKSAIISSIAKKLDFQFIDLRLSQMDELSVGLFPTLSGEINGSKSFTFAIPDWALIANERPTIISFEELNRTSQAVMDAVLGILNEKRIGTRFVFNENVYMVSTGNLGDDDGTVVKEFDMALKNRLVTFKHKFTIQDWIDGYANENVIPQIVNFIDAKPSHFYSMTLTDTDKVDAFATPRSWSNLSNYIKAHYGDEPTIDEVLECVNEVGSNYIGVTNVPFIAYLEEIKTVSVKDIIDNYSKHKKTIESMNRVQRTEMAREINSLDIKTLSDKQISNITKFASLLGKDELIAMVGNLIVDNLDELYEMGKQSELPYKKRHNAFKILGDVENIEEYWNDLKNYIAKSFHTGS